MDDLRVEIDGGIIEGEILTSELNQDRYRSFKGVPYARPPIGSLRFQPPESVEKWDGVLRCTEERDMCVQKNLFGNNPQDLFAGSEDCLYLNIYSPVENPEKSLRPVMVFIHGGGFQFGNKNSNVYGPDFLITRGVVLVLMNYRLNIFGFLNLGIKECPGNVGLLDQRAALVWVKKHIQKFNGDPENITLFGESAGSASVHYQLISPLSRGLFHKAILQSGSSLDAWAYMDPSVSVDRAFRVGKHLGFSGTDVKELHKFLLNVPARTLGEAIFHILTPEERAEAFGMPFVPSKETVGAYKDRFLPDDPRTLLTEPPEVPVLCGLTSAEGLLVYFNFNSEDPPMLPLVLKDTKSAFDKGFPKDLIKLSTDEARVEAAKSKVRQFYMKGDCGSDSVIANTFAGFSGDLMFGRGNHQMLKSYLSSPLREPIYLYLFDFESNISLLRSMAGLPNYLKGASHGDDLKPLFNCKLFSGSALDSEAFMCVMKHMLTIWTNFAKFGNPNPHGELGINWEPISSDKVSHCKIHEKLEIQPGFIFEERMTFWDELTQSMLN